MSSALKILVTDVAFAPRFRVSGGAGRIPCIASLQAEAVMTAPMAGDDADISGTVDYAAVVRLILGGFDSDAPFADMDDLAAVMADRVMALDRRILTLRVEIRASDPTTLPPAVLERRRPDALSPAILVTGGGVRLGRAIAEACAAKGWALAIHYRNSCTEAEELAASIRSGGGNAVTVGGDLADPERVASLVDAAAAALGRPLTGLVNSASVFEWDGIGTLDAAGFLRHMLPNALAPCLLIQALLRQLPEGVTGAVVNLLDHKLASPNGDHFSYTLSKYALMGATEILARSEAPRLRVNAVAPGYTLPAPGQDAADFRRLHTATPLGIGPQATDIAAAAVWLLEAPAVTGQTIHVDAGYRFTAARRDYAFS